MTVPYDERDDETGQFTPSFHDDEFADAIQATSGTTSDIADAVGCTYRNAYQRLHDLEDEGRITADKVGNTLVWRLADTPTPPPSPHDHDANPRGSVDTDRGFGAEIFEHDDYTEPIPQNVDRGELLDAIAAARDYLREHGRAQKTDFVRDVMPSHPLKYDADAALETIEAGERYRGKWWRLVRDGLKALPEVEKPDNPMDPWRYVDG